MNARFALAPLGILEILILIGVLFAIVALLRNPTGRKIFLTILTVVFVVGAVLFAGIFTLRVSHFPAPGVPSVQGPLTAAKAMAIPLVWSVLLLCVLFGIIGVIRGVKNKKFGVATVVIILVCLIPVLLFFLLMPVAYFRIRQAQPAMDSSATIVSPSSSDQTLVLPSPPGYTTSSIPLPPAYSTPSIWQEGVASQFTANVYPTKALALKSLRPKIDEILRKIAEGKSTPPKVILFASGLGAAEIHSLMDSSGTNTANWTVEPLPRNLQEDEVSVAAMFTVTGSRTETRDNMTLKTENGILEVSVNSGGNRNAITAVKAMVEEKPWLVDLAGYQSTHPQTRLLIGRSWSEATEEKVAEQEAVADACRQVNQVLQEMNPQQGSRLSGNLSVNPTDIESRGMILDRFSQQLYGIAGPICRHALLIDLSPAKVQPLANAKFALVETVRQSWARLILSFVGMAAIIALVYAFLNAATRGYYTWSLRIAAAVLLVAGIAIVVSLA
jgi:hypothetical protein